MNDALRHLDALAADLEIVGESIELLLLAVTRTSRRTELTADELAMTGEARRVEVAKRRIIELIVASGTLREPVAAGRGAVARRT